MSFRKTVVYLSAILLCAFGLAGAQTENKLTAAEVKAGWILLFDGTDKHAEWKVGETGGEFSNTWNVENNWLVSPDRSDMLFSKKTFSNFEWTAEWKQTSGGNSGLFIRVPTSPGWLCGTYEYSILDDYGTNSDGESKGHLPGEYEMYMKRTASVYDMYPTTTDGKLSQDGGTYVGVAKQWHEWNKGVVWANGNYIEHWLNDKKVVEAEIGSAEWEKRFQASKFPGGGYNCNTATYAKSASGFLGVQDHGGGLFIKLRNLKIRQFTPGEKLNSPLITPAGGAFATATKVILDAAITGATIRYTLDGADPTESSPIYRDSLRILNTATLKTRTYRTRFSASDVASASFQIGPSSIKSLAGFSPDVDVSLQANALTVVNKNGVTFQGEIRSVAGKVVADFNGSRTTEVINLNTLAPGLYVVNMRSATWNRTLKVAIP